MAGERVSKILRAKTNLSDEEIANISDADGWKIIYSTKNPTVKKKVRDQICFTGFSPSEKNRLAQEAYKYNLDVVKTVTKRLCFLCCGPNAGPSKLDKAKKQGVIILTQAELLQMYETGEVP